MSEKCLKCFRPLKTCYCRDIKPFDPGIKFVFLMHPVEAYKQKTGTGRLASLTLVNSEIIIGEEFDNNTRVNELILEKSNFPMILYPDKNAAYAEKFNFNAESRGRKLLIFLIDGTWDQARKMMFHSPALRKLPCLSFSREYRSRFSIKKQPKDFCLSTIESSYYLIKELQKNRICPRDINTEPLIDIFDRMVQFQIDCEVKYSPKNPDQKSTDPPKAGILQGLSRNEKTVPLLKH